MAAEEPEPCPICQGPLRYCNDGVEAALHRAYDHGKADAVAEVVAAVEVEAVRWEWEADNQAQWRGRSYAGRLRAALKATS